MRSKQVAMSFFIFMFVSGAPVYAQNFGTEAWGILTDPLKLGKSSSNLLEAVERSAIHIERIEGKVNDDARERLEQIDKTIRETRDKLEEVTDHAFDRTEQITNLALFSSTNCRMIFLRIQKRWLSALQKLAQKSCNQELLGR